MCILYMAGSVYILIDLADSVHASCVHAHTHTHATCAGVIHDLPNCHSTNTAHTRTHTHACTHTHTLTQPNASIEPSFHISCTLGTRNDTCVQVAYALSRIRTLSATKQIHPRSQRWHPYVHNMGIT